MDLEDQRLEHISVTEMKRHLPKGTRYEAGRETRIIGEDLPDNHRLGLFAVLDVNGNKIGEGTRLSLYVQNNFK